MKTFSGLFEKISQLIYHIQVMMIAKGLRPVDVWERL